MTAVPREIVTPLDPCPTADYIEMSHPVRVTLPRIGGDRAVTFSIIPFALVAICGVG